MSSRKSSGKRRTPWHLTDFYNNVPNDGEISDVSDVQSVEDVEMISDSD